MTLVDEGMPNPYGEALAQELLWIHGIIRSNLQTIAQVSQQVSGGAPVGKVRAQIDELASSSVVWTLRVNCMRYCSLVHGHHHHEDAAFFPGLRRANPALGSIIDRLEADHRVVSTLLDEVEAAAERITIEEEARFDLAQALNKLAEHLLSHLEFEEESLTPTLRRLQGWPRL